MSKYIKMNRQRARERAKEQVVRSASKPMSLNKRSSSPSTKSTQKALESALNLSLVPTDQNWALDMRGEKSGAVAQITRIATPAGFISGNFENTGDTSKQVDHTEKIKKSAMTMAMAPGQQLFMTAFMLWMSGKNLQIFSIMMLGMAFFRPVSALFDVSNKFARYNDSGADLSLAKLTYVALNLAGVGIALFKCYYMGLIPGPADWIDDATRAPLEFSAGSINFS